MHDLVLIPGLGSDAAVWARTIDALGDDARCTVGDTLRDDSLAGMARRILDAAPPRFALAGLSMGGMVALEVVRAAPERVTALALVDSNAFPDTPEEAEQRRRAIASASAGDGREGDRRDAIRASLAWLIHPDAPAEVGDEIVAMGLRVGAETYVRQLTAVLHRDDQRPLLARIAVPAVVVSGAEDAMVPVSRAKAMSEAIPGAVLAVIPDCGHLSPLEKPHAVARHLRDLLERAAPARAS